MIFKQIINPPYAEGLPISKCGSISPQEPLFPDQGHGKVNVNGKCHNLENIKENTKESI